MAEKFPWSIRVKLQILSEGRSSFLGLEVPSGVEGKLELNGIEQLLFLSAPKVVRVRGEEYHLNPYLAGDIAQLDASGLPYRTLNYKLEA